MLHELRYRIRKALQRRRTYRATLCGHLTKRFITLELNGEYRHCELTIEDGKTSWCETCLNKMSIQCSLCGLPIFVGDPVSLCKQSNPDIIPPIYAAKHHEGNQLYYVACMRWDCADTGLALVGYWHTPGEVLRIMSPMDQLLMVMNEGVEAPLIFNDISNPAQVQKDLQANQQRIDSTRNN